MSKLPLALALCLGACTFDGGGAPPIDPLPDPANPVTPAALVIDHTAHDFGNVVVGDPSPLVTFGVRDLGGSATGILQVTLAGDGDFTIADDGCSGLALPVGGACRVTLAFDPSAAGLRAATVSITDGAQTATADLAGAGAFAPPRLQVDVSGNGRAVGSGLDCGGSCAASFAPGTPVALYAVPGPNAAFAGWHGGACDGSIANTCAFAMNGAAAITAEFVPRYRLTLDVGPYHGLVHVSKHSDCTGGDDQVNTCLYDFAVQKTVTFEAVSDPSSCVRFAGWQGDCGGDAPRCTLMTDRDHHAIAVFKQVCD